MNNLLNSPWTVLVAVLLFSVTLASLRACDNQELFNWALTKCEQQGGVFAKIYGGQYVCVKKL